MTSPNEFGNPKRSFRVEIIGAGSTQIEGLVFGGELVMITDSIVPSAAGQDFPGNVSNAAVAAGGLMKVWGCCEPQADGQPDYSHEP